MIRIGSVCRNYADIEWIGDRDDSHTKIRALIQKIRDFTEREFKIKPALYVCCSSREKDGCYKNSYHVVFRDLHFENNHGGPMKRFWNDLCLELDSEEWKCPTGKQHIIDLSVYTKYRNMRLPLASKRGGAPFKRISGDPFDESDDFTSEYADEDCVGAIFRLGSPSRQQHGPRSESHSCPTKQEAKDSAPQYR
jgi:hypothetical protein